MRYDFRELEMREKAKKLDEDTNLISTGKIAPKEINADDFHDSVKHAVLNTVDPTGKLSQHWQKKGGSFTKFLQTSVRKMTESSLSATRSFGDRTLGVENEDIKKSLRLLHEIDPELVTKWKASGEDFNIFLVREIGKLHDRKPEDDGFDSDMMAK
jgi:hypothetical protein